MEKHAVRWVQGVAFGVLWVQEVAFGVWLRSRRRPDMFTGRHDSKIFSILPSSCGQLNADVPS